MAGSGELSGSHGGKRLNAGRKPAAYEADSLAHYLVFKEAQAKREAARAELSELELAQKRRELLPIAEVKADADRQARIVRDTLLALPDRVAALMLGLDEREMARVLRAEVRAALQHISEAIAGE